MGERAVTVTPVGPDGALIDLDASCPITATLATPAFTETLLVALLAVTVRLATPAAAFVLLPVVTVAAPAVNATVESPALVLTDFPVVLAVTVREATPALTEIPASVSPETRESEATPDEVLILEAG